MANNLAAQLVGSEIHGFHTLQGTYSLLILELCLCLFWSSVSDQHIVFCFLLVYR